ERRICCWLCSKNLESSVNFLATAPHACPSEPSGGGFNDRRPHCSISNQFDNLEESMRLRLTVWALGGLLPALMSAFSGDALAQRGAASPRPEDNRPPLFFREEWKHPFDSGGPAEGPVGQEHVSNPNLQLRAYGEKPKNDPQPATGEHTH